MEKKVSGSSTYEANDAHLSLVTSSLFRICVVPQENLRGRYTNDVVTSHALEYMVGYLHPFQSQQNLTIHSFPLFPLMVGLGYRWSQSLTRIRIFIQMVSNLPSLLLVTVFLFSSLIGFSFSYRTVARLELNTPDTCCTNVILGLTDRVYIPSPDPLYYLHCVIAATQVYL